MRPNRRYLAVLRLKYRDQVFVLRSFQAVSLEKFRSLQDKLLLLDFAVSAHDGNVITAVTVFHLIPDGTRVNVANGTATVCPCDRCLCPYRWWFI